MSDTTGLWLAVDALTKPTRRRIARATDDTAVGEASDLLHDLDSNPTRTVCRVVEYRRAMQLLPPMTSSHGTIPPLVDQATAAVAGQGDTDGSGAVPARERSIADLNLMETLHGLREILAAELHERGRTPRDKLTARIRQVASEVAADLDPETLHWWTWRFEHYQRVIANQLNALENGPRPFRLRGAPCPECHARQVPVVEQGERRLVPPLRIDFKDGAVRAAQCTACAATWFRGDALNELADLLRPAAAETA